MDSITFEVIGKPQGKGRPRVSMRFGKIHIYTPQKTVDYELLVGNSYIAAGGKNFGSTAICVSIVAVVRPPKMFKRKEFTAAINGILKPHDTKPDLDNVEKAVLDGLNGIAYADDRNVVELTSKKLFGEQEKLIITIWEVK